MGERNQEITDYFNKYDDIKTAKLETIRTIIHENIQDIQEKLWTKVPCFYKGKRMILIRVFDDHINFIADSVVQYKDELKDYKITPKGMLQIFDNQELPEETLKKIILLLGY